jgi:hypothetical protein
VIVERPKRLGGGTLLLPSAAVSLAAEGGAEGIHEGHLKSPICQLSCGRRRPVWLQGGRIA